MRIRRKPWARPELAACSYFVADPQKQRGSWQQIFGAVRPIHLDLGCGKCPFLADVAFAHRDKNHIGIDISMDILGVGRRNIAARFGEEEPDNVALTAYNIEKLGELFGPEEKVERIYINFCNPWPCAGDHKKRLTHTRQLATYKTLLAPKGEIWFKTDNDDLYLATRRYLTEAGFQIVLDTKDLHSEEGVENILTEHEIMFTKEGIKTKALRAFLPEA
jgi:tRNA (guanine-N7-)-methyltransferase